MNDLVELKTCYILHKNYKNMKLLEIKREGENLYLITFEVKSIFKKPTIYEKHIFCHFASYYNFSDTGKSVGFELDRTISSLVPQLKGYEPIIIK